MKSITAILDDYGDIIAAGLNDWEVKDYAFDKAYSLFNNDWSNILSALDYQSTEDLRADTVTRGLNDFWDSLNWEIKEGHFIERGQLIVLLPEKGECYDL